MSEHKQNTLQYFIAEKNSVVILSWVGTLAHETIRTIEECQSELLKIKAKWVVMNCRDLHPQMDKSVVPIFAKLSKTIREMPATLRLASIHPELRSYLESQGLLRNEELALNLTEALKFVVKPD
jgi:anti-anti-sigma regulatory factor